MRSANKIFPLLTLAFAPFAAALEVPYDFHVPCTPEKDICPTGLYCTAENQCVVGCNDDSDCNLMTKCETDKHACVGCVIDTH